MPAAAPRIRSSAAIAALITVLPLVSAASAPMAGPPPSASPSSSASDADKTRAEVARAAMNARWRKSGGAEGPLGDKESALFRAAGGFGWRFSGGNVYWIEATGAHSVLGRMQHRLRAIGGPGSVGFPDREAMAAQVSGATAQRFQRARFYLSQGTGAHTVRPPFLQPFLNRGGVQRYGLPVHERAAARAKGARVQEFQRARWFYSRRTGAHVLWGQILERYLRVGGTTSWLGLPRRDQHDVTAGTRADFVHGSLLRSDARHRILVRRPFTAEVSSVTAAELPYSYRSGCPVAPSALRKIRVVHRQFDGDDQVGTLVVAESVVADITRVFRDAHGAGFAVRRIEKVDRYGGDDVRSMEADNTSAFNCRKVTGNPYRLSQHSYGNAIDVNPFENPYVTSSSVYPDGSDSYLDRDNVRPGMIIAGRAVAAAFAAEGWYWGARWSNPDYQHFSSNGG